MSVPIEPVPLHFNPDRRQVSPDLEPYNHVALLANPAARYEQAASYHHERLLVRGNEHGFMVDKEPIETADNVDGNKEILSRLGLASIIAIVGGDGTASMVMQAAYELGLTNPFMLLTGGNAKNQARMHHLRTTLYRPERILRFGAIRPVFPLIVARETLDSDQPIDETVAFAYASIGMTALATAGFNTPEHRKVIDDAEKHRRLVKFREEAEVTLAARKNIVPFIIHENGQRARIRTDVVYASGKLMAKYVRFPSDLFEPECSVVEAPDSEYLTILRTALNLALPFARNRHHHLKPGERQILKLVTIDGSDLHFESDGDAGTDPSGTTYTFSISDKSVNVITTRSPSIASRLAKSSR